MQRLMRCGTLVMVKEVETSNFLETLMIESWIDKGVADFVEGLQGIFRRGFSFLERWGKWYFWG